MGDKRHLDLIISPEASIRAAIKRVERLGTRGVFVCDPDRVLIGIVMDLEIRRAVLKNMDLESPVSRIMKTAPFCVPEDLSKKRRRELMLESGKLLAPVVDRANRVTDFIYAPEIWAGSWSEAGSGNGLGAFPPSRVLVIGGAGYIGSVLVKKLLRLGHEVRCLDLLLYGREPLDSMNGNRPFEFIQGDCRDRDLLARALEGADAVVHLGEIVGDPACTVNEDETIDTNYVATSRMVDLCRKHNVPRFVFTSSCSVYGQNENMVHEDSELNPVSLYARCKIECERAILAASGRGFSPTILRLATVHGRSHRQRFDLVVNLLTIKGLAERKISIFGGSQWRPFISVHDVVRGILRVLHSDRSKVGGGVFNLGDSRENYTIDQIGNLVGREIPGVEVQRIVKEEDPRNYRVSFDKIRENLGFTCERDVVDSVRELASAWERENIFRDYNAPRFHNVLALK